jgi:hypothetical protein
VVTVSHVYRIRPPFQKQPYNDDVYEAYPYSYPTAEQVKEHEEAIGKSIEALKVKCEPYAEMVKAHNEAIKQFKEERAAKEAKEGDIRHHAWE